MDKFPPESPAIVKSSSISNPSSVVTRVLNEELAAVKEPVIPTAVKLLISEALEPSEPLTADLKSESVKSIAKVLLVVISPPPVKPVPAVNVTELWFICSFATNPLRLS